MFIIKLASLELYVNLERGWKQRGLNQSEIEAKTYSIFHISVFNEFFLFA